MHYMFKLGEAGWENPGAGVSKRLVDDDGFGPRVIVLLAVVHMPHNIELRDLGTAGLTVATDLVDFDMRAVFMLFSTAELPSECLSPTF